MSEKTTISYNPKWLGLLGVIFVVAKVFGIAPVADWSWWLVLLPFYLGLAIVVGVFLFGGALFAAGYGLLKLLDKYQDRKRRIAREKAQVWRALENKDIK